MLFLDILRTTGLLPDQSVKRPLTIAYLVAAPMTSAPASPWEISNRWGSSVDRFRDVKFGFKVTDLQELLCEIDKHFDLNRGFVVANEREGFVMTMSPPPSPPFTHVTGRP